MFIPAYDKNGATKNTSIIYHVAKEDIEKVMQGSADRNLTPDFVISVTLDGYDSYEVESMDINKKTKKMTMCGNCHRVKDNSGQDMYHSLNALTFI